MTKNKPDILFNPQEVADRTVAQFTEEQKHGSFMTVGIADIDDHYVMHRSTKVNGIIADTSQGKTTYMNILAESFLRQIKENEVIVYVTWEDSVEALSAPFFARATQIPLLSLYYGDLDPDQWTKILEAAVLRAETPLWVMGHSEQDTKRRPRLTLTDVWLALEWIKDIAQKDIKAVIFDYLQRMNRGDKRGDIREQFMSCMDTTKDIALGFNTDVTVGSQIGRDVADRKEWKQPQMHDAQETSNFEQTCDGIQSLWMPYKSGIKLGTSLLPASGGKPHVSCTKDLILIETLKQKMGEAPKIRAFDFDPVNRALRPYTPGNIPAPVQEKKASQLKY